MERVGVGPLGAAHIEIASFQNFWSGIECGAWGLTVMTMRAASQQAFQPFRPRGAENVTRVSGLVAHQADAGHQTRMVPPVIALGGERDRARGGRVVHRYNRDLPARDAIDHVPPPALSGRSYWCGHGCW